MKKSDKWVTIRVSVEQAKVIKNVIYSRYTHAFNEGKKTETHRLLLIWHKLRRLLEIEDD